MNVQATFAATLVDEWARAGVTDAVVCPGSRSTPLALALAADHRLRLHVHHDERAAGFLALGIGLASGRPAVLLTTSGTAAAELHPSVVEASMAGVPLLVCTADRPPELRDVGAPQTIDQDHLYGRAVRWFADPGVADDGNRHAWRALASRAVMETNVVRPGPVHLNLPFREPLVGEPDELPAGRSGEAPWLTSVRPVVEPDTATAALLASGRGLIVAGSSVGDPDAVAALADTTGWPVLADPRSGCRRPSAWTVAAFDALLRDEGFAAAHRPDVVVRLGSPPASRVLATWLAATGATEIAVDRGGVVYDPDHTASAVVHAMPDAWCRAIVPLLGGVADPSWLADWQAAEKAAQAAFDEVLAGYEEPTEPGVARALVADLAPGSTLVVGSSMPVRDLEWYSRPRNFVRVLSNRGANGIDGVVSTAVGVAVASDGPVAALVGDISFLHDSNALLGLAGRELDLTIVVVDNRGGGIFSFLPQATALAPERFEQLFGTPHDVDLRSLAVVHGLPALSVHTADGLAPALAVAAAAPGTHVIVVRTDRATNVAVHDHLHAAVSRSLSR